MPKSQRRASNPDSVNIESTSDAAQDSGNEACVELILGHSTRTRTRTRIGIGIGIGGIITALSGALAASASIQPMTRSARARSDAGTAMPSALAARWSRLIA